MVAFRERKTRDRRINFWFPLTVCLLLIGTAWLGFRQFEAQQKTNQLFRALRAADPISVRAALDHGANPNSVMSVMTEGTVSNGLIFAVRQWFAQMLHHDQTLTALTAAVYSEDPQCVHILLDRGAFPTQRNSDGSTPLMAAAGIQHFGDPKYTQSLVHSHLQVMQMLLDKGADVNASARDGSTALGKSISGGYNGIMDLTVPRFLLTHGSNANAKSLNGMTPLEWAVTNGDNQVVPLVGLLLDHGANVNETYSNGGCPIQRATEWINPSLVQTLVLHGADLNVHSPGNDMTPLIQAVRQGQISTIKLLLAKGADVNAFSKFDSNAFSKFDSSALFLATQSKRADIVKLLLDHGASPNYINSFEMCVPALVVAAANNNAQILRLLIARGADVNLGGEDDTPLTAAASSDLLTAYGNRHGVVDPSDIKNLAPVAHPHNVTVAQILLAAGADANKPNQAGNAALVYAVAGHNLPLVRLLRAHGANPTTYGANPYAPDSQKESPLTLASERGYSDLIPLLR